MPSSAVVSKKCDIVNQRVKAPAPKRKLKPAQAVSKGVAIAVGEPNMEIDAQAAEEVDADERLRPGFAQEAPPAIPLGMEERLELSLVALLSSILD